MKRNKAILLVLVAAIVSMTMSGCYLFPKEEKVLAPPLIAPEKVVYNTIDVKTGVIEKQASGTANFEPVNFQDSYFKFNSGYLKAIYVKLGDNVKKGQVIAELDTGHLSSEIEEQEINLEKAQLDYESTAVGGARIDIKRAELNVKLEKIKLKDLQDQLSKSKLCAPITGQVTYVDTVNAGDYINAFKSIVRVADTSKLQLQYITSNSSSFKLGMNILVKYRGKEYQGKVLSTPDSSPATKDENAKNKVVITVDNLPSDISVGESADINVVFEKKENVIVIPKSVVTTYSGRNFVQVLENGVPVERDVELGMEASTGVEVVKGLKVGDKVIER